MFFYLCDLVGLPEERTGPSKVNFRQWELQQFSYVVLFWFTCLLLKLTLKDLEVHGKHSVVRVHSLSISFFKHECPIETSTPTLFIQRSVVELGLSYIFSFIRITLWYTFTLPGDAPRVISRGGFSGLFPDSSLDAYIFALQTSVADAVLWCDVQLTKDGAGICFPDLNMSNASIIEVVYPKGQKTYPVNGVPTQGWFTVDFSLKDLNKVYCKSSLPKKWVLHCFSQLLTNVFFLFFSDPSYFISFRQIRW